MPEQTQLEILISARAQIDQAINQTTAALERVQAPVRQMDISLQQALRSGRAFAIGLVGELNPALAGSIAEFTAMAQSARLASTAVAAVATVGIAAAVTGLALWISKTKEQAEAQAKLNDLVQRMDVSGLQSKMRELRLELDIVNLRLKDSFGTFLNIIDNILGGLGKLKPGEGALTRLLIGDPEALKAKLAEFEERFKKVFPIEARQRLAEQGAKLTEKEFDSLLSLISGLPTGEQVNEFTSVARQRIDAIGKSLHAALDAERQKQLAQAQTPEEREFIVNLFLGKKEELNLTLQGMVNKLGQTAQEAKDKIQRPFKDISESLQQDFDQMTTSVASALIKIKDEFGPEGLAGAIQAAGLPVEVLIEKMEEIERTPIRALQRYEDALRRQREELERQIRAVERLADTIGATFSDTMFGAIEGRIKSFGEAVTRILTNVSRDISRQVFQNISRIAFGARPEGGGLFPFSPAGPEQLLRPGTLSVAGTGVQLVQGGIVPPLRDGRVFTGVQADIESLEFLATQQALGGRAGPSISTLSLIPTPSLPVSSGLGFLTSPLFTVGGISVPLEEGGAMTVGGIGITPIGLIGAGIGGAGIGLQLGGIPGAISGAVFGVGGFIGGTALAAALQSAALSFILPGIGTILGGLAGGFLSRLLFGGGEATRQERIRVAQQQASEIMSKLPSLATQHPILAEYARHYIEFVNNRLSQRISSGEAKRLRNDLIEINAAFGNPDQLYNELATGVAAGSVPPPMGKDEMFRREAELLEIVAEAQAGPITFSRFPILIARAESLLSGVGGPTLDPFFRFLSDLRLDFQRVQEDVTKAIATAGQETFFTVQERIAADVTRQRIVSGLPREGGFFPSGAEIRAMLPFIAAELVNDVLFMEQLTAKIRELVQHRDFTLVPVIQEAF